MWSFEVVGIVLTECSNKIVLTECDITSHDKSIFYSNSNCVSSCNRVLERLCALFLESETNGFFPVKKLGVLQLQTHSVA